MEKMQAQEMMSGLRIPEMDELGHFFRSLPTSTLVGIGALTAVLAYWFATRPRPIKPPCSLQHQSEEVPVRCNTHTQSYKSPKTAVPTTNTSKLVQLHRLDLRLERG